MGQGTERAAEALEVKPSELTSFRVEDPFNDNELAGLICRRPDHRYGALWITEVNGANPAPQLILGTPKFPYPVDKNGVFRFPETQRIEAYTKYDGTNIFGFRYRDWNGNLYVSYKTRLTPVVQQSRFGPFLDYWREMLRQYPDIPKAVLSYRGYGLSYELFGAKNKHLVIYEASLDARLLFGVTTDGALEPPSILADYCYCPPALLYRVVTDSRDLVGIYRSMQAEIESKLTSDELLGGFRGDEGLIWYILSQGRWLAFKLKPETIEAIHWAAGGISRNVIAATAYNVLENYDRCTPERIRELLLEEFNETEIDIAWRVIMRVSGEVNQEIEFKETVYSAYDNLGIDILADKRTAMRALSTKLPKSQMRKAYAVLMQRALAPVKEDQ